MDIESKLTELQSKLDECQRRVDMAKGSYDNADYQKAMVRLGQLLDQCDSMLSIVEDTKAKDNFDKAIAVLQVKEDLLKSDSESIKI